MAYRYHPEIEGLKINEDGSDIVYCGDHLVAKKAPKKKRHSDLTYVYFNSKTHSVGKLICECWHGMAENPRWCAVRKEKEKGIHYTNLEWKPCGFNHKTANGTAKRSSWSKISKEDIPDIEERLENKETLKAIAADYDTTDMSISRIKKKFEKRKKLEEKETKKKE